MDLSRAKPHLRTILIASALLASCDATLHGGGSDAVVSQPDSPGPIDQGPDQSDGDAGPSPASDGAGDDGDTTVPPPADGGGDAGDDARVLPAHFLAGYNEMWGNPLMPSAMPVHYIVLYHAFATIASDGAVVDVLQYKTNPAAATMAAEYAARRAAGKPTLLSIGGAGGSQNNLSTAAAQNQFMATITPMINFYGFDGIDWDIEQGSIAGATSGIVTVSRLLRKQYGSGFIISMAPYGDATVVSVYKDAAKQLQQTGDLSYVGFQFYNSQEPTTASVLAEIQSWVGYCGITPEQFVIGMWYGPWDWPAGFTFAYSKMVAIWNGVRAVHPGIRGMYTWGIRACDQPAGYPFANTLGPIVNVP